MWELWTGKEPYEGLNYHALLHQITLTNGGLRPPVPTGPKWEGDACPEPAPGWAHLMERCWHEVPEDRPGFDEVCFQSWSAFLQYIQFSFVCLTGEGMPGTVDGITMSAAKGCQAGLMLSCIVGASAL